MVIEILNNSEVYLPAFTLNQESVAVAQPVGFPKVKIDRMTPGGEVPILADTVMTAVRDGEYFYRWIPNTLGEYKVRYTAIVDGITIFGYDIVIVRTSAPSQYGGAGRA